MACRLEDQLKNREVTYREDRVLTIRVKDDIVDAPAGANKLALLSRRRLCSEWKSCPDQGQRHTMKY